MDVSKENLELILEAFAAKICERHGIRFFNGGYKILVEEEMLCDTLIEAGNPVLIRFHLRILADGLAHNKMAEVRFALQRALEISSKRMLHTLSQSPIAPALKKDSFKDHRWTRQKSSDQLLPTLLPAKEVTFNTFIQTTAIYSKGGEMFTWTEKGYAHKTSVGELERKAMIGLSRDVLNKENEDGESDGSIPSASDSASDNGHNSESGGSS